MPGSVDIGTVHRWCRSGLAALRHHQREIDALNVFPVPDTDTGTNLVLTMTAATEALERVAPDLALAEASRAAAPPLPAEPGSTPLGVALAQLAQGALLGARGNSGAILAQYLRGLADGLRGIPAADGHQVAQALGCASSAAYAAVAVPVDGTILTVAAAAALQARRAATADVSSVLHAAEAAARTALARTPDQLPDLAGAGVVDAGGVGLVLLLAALAEAVSGIPPAPVAMVPVGPVPMGLGSDAGGSAGSGAVGSGDPEVGGYEVQYLLDAGPAEVQRLRGTLTRLGDSLVIVPPGADGQAGTWHVHVHVADAGAAIEAGLDAGRLHRIGVTALPRRGGCRHGRAVVAICAGSGLRELIEAEGATVVEYGTGAPAIADIVSAVQGTGAAEVVVLSDARTTAAVAAAAVGQVLASGIRTALVPARSPVQALAALAVRDAGRRLTDDVIAMAEAAAGCRAAEVTTAGGEALTVVGRCHPGDVLALVDGEVNLIGAGVVEVSQQVLDRMLVAGGELVTLVVGEDAPDGLAVRLGEYLRGRWPFVEVQCFFAQRSHHALLVGVE